MNGKNLMLDEGILEACEYIREIYSGYGISIPAGSWLWQNLNDGEHIGKGHKLRVPPDRFHEMKLYILGSMANIQMFSKNLRICIEAGKNLENKLPDVLDLKYANGKIHEIHNLACLLRSGLDADFIQENGTKTPDIQVVGKGVLECKTVKSEEAIARELVKSSRQMRGYEGEKVTDFYLYLGKPLTVEYIDQLWRKSISAVKSDLERIKAFNGFSFSFPELKEGPGGLLGFETKNYRWVVEGSVSGLEILRALQNTM